jgi:hypothetical protein
MRTSTIGETPQTLWPDTLSLTLEELVTDPGAADRPVSLAYEKAQRIRLDGPVRLGVDPVLDRIVLRFLGEATSQLVELEWTLLNVLPWPARTVVHLVPPRHCPEPELLRWWRENHRFGLCTYRRGPDFVRILDIRPGGQRLRAVAEGAWAQRFAELAAVDAAPATGGTARLLDDLVDSGLALRLGNRPHLLPFWLRRWPVPHPDQ